MTARIAMAMVVVVMVMRVRIADGRANDFVPNEQGDGFPEIPEATMNGFPARHAASQAPHDQSGEHGGHRLQDHELGQASREMRRARRQQIRQELRQLKVRYIPHVMKWIAMP